MPLASVIASLDGWTVFGPVLGRGIRINAVAPGPDASSAPMVASPRPDICWTGRRYLTTTEQE